MAFESMTAEQYRAMSAEEFEQRRAFVAEACLDPECEATAEQLRSEAAIIKSEAERRNTAAELRSLDVAAVASGAGNVVGGMAALETRSAAAAPKADDPCDTPEYRNAFMEYVCRGTVIPMELREASTTTTADAPVMIPTTLQNQIVEKMSEYGDIWNKVTKMNVQGGIEFPVLDLKADAFWIGEEETSEYQKLMADEKISFMFYQLECRMAQTILASVTTFAAFQQRFVPTMAEAMVRALEQAIVRGDGSGKFLGVTKDVRVTNVVELSAAEIGDWQAWHKKVKAKMPKAYRQGEFYMCQSTWDTYIETMADDNRAPVSIGYNPVTGEEVLRLVGKNVCTTEPDILPDFDSAEVGDVIGLFIDWKNYVVNSQMVLKADKWHDYETNKDKYRALLIADGKVLDPYGIILIKKGASA